MAIPIIVWLIAGGSALLLGEGCANPRKKKETDAPDHNYNEIKPILDKGCVPCHRPEQASGNYDLSVYVKKTPEGLRGILGNGSDSAPNAIAGDPSSLILTKLDEVTHRGYLTPEARATLTHWVVHDRLATCSSGIHPCGWLNPKAPDFHGEDLARDNWNLAPCRQCHGDEGEAGGAYGGGKVTVGFGDTAQSCVQCHGESPESCTTCHGEGADPAPPRSLRWGGSLGAGAHQSHLSEAEISDPVPCATCHTVPDRFDDPAHIDSARPAEVTFGALATHNGFSPVWDRMTVSCSAVYCHQEGTPVWTKVDGTQKTCTSCHTTHSDGIVEGRCNVCHGTVVDAAKTIVAPPLHVNGSVQVGSEGVAPDLLACTSCHDLEGNPPRALDWEGSMGPAAHWKHLTTGLTQPIGCPECHRVPAALFAAGHLDSALPAEIFFGPGGRASLTGFSPAWNAADATCTVYCHSPVSPGPSPAWDAPAAVIGCDFCHYAPPAPPHPQLLGVQNCLFCHPDVTDEEGHIDRPDLHIDGQVQYSQ